MNFQEINIKDFDLKLIDQKIRCLNKVRGFNMKTLKHSYSYEQKLFKTIKSRQLIINQENNTEQPQQPKITEILTTLNNSIQVINQVLPQTQIIISEPQIINIVLPQPKYLFDSIINNKLA